MARLLLKIFVAYWIAAGAMMLIFDLGPHRHLHMTQLEDAIDASLAMNGRMLAMAYQSGGCATAARAAAGNGDALYLAAPDGHLLCGDPGLSGSGRLVRAAVASGKRMVANHELSQLFAVPVTVGGTTYVVLLKNRYGMSVEVFGVLPGANTIAISCGVTLFLALLMALPVRRLRAAAGEIAMGKLDTRVKWNSPTSRFTGGDDIDQLCRDFNYMAERLQSLADAQRLLLCEVSHELRSPLARLGVGLSLARTESSSAMREHLDRIESEAARLNYLIGQLLSLSNLDLTQSIEAPRIFSLSELVADLLPDLQYEAAHTDCVIEAFIHPGCAIRGDEELLRAAVENIVRNAIKYTGNGGLIQIETRSDSAGECHLLRVCDNGPGIPEHELGAVLKPFYRADRSRHWQQEGFGIGLAIAERAIKLHAGTIEIRNRTEGGLAVEIRLPAACSAEAQLDKSAHLSPVGQSDASR